MKIDSSEAYCSVCPTAAFKDKVYVKYKYISPYFLAGMVNVEWDTGIRCNYSHGYGGIYNVVVCDEPRIPEDGFAAVGCFVKRGKCSQIGKVHV